MRKLWIALLAAAAVAFSGQAALADHHGAGSHTYCANKKYRAHHKKQCRHWGAHHHHGVHLEGSY